MLPTFALRQIADWLSEGHVIGYPTETLYGLGCDPLNAEAVRRVFTLKGRPEDKPLPVLLPEGDPSRFGIRMTPLAWRLCRHWPAALTLVVPVEGFPNETTAGTTTIAVRRSPHPFVRALLKHWNRPLTTTSANPSGQPPATSGVGMWRYFHGRLQCFVDGGDLPGVGSTVVDCTGETVRLLRAGAFPVEKLD